jgi:uncharacterized membrane protein YbhN (UPF0104 family)
LKKQWILGLVVLAVLAALLVYAQHKYPFHWESFVEQFKLANPLKIAIALACIYAGYVFRSVRWAWLLRHDKKIPPLALLGTQVIGFAAIALIGRIADPVRPYLVAKKTGLTLSNQVAVYIVERLFDLGSTALIFSLAILMLAPGAMAHPGPHKAGALSHLLTQFPLLASIVERFGGLIVTACAALFLFAVRFAGERVAAILEGFFGRFSKPFGKAVAHKILSFRSGLCNIRSFSDFAVTTVLSLAMWALITLAYLETMQAFTASPQLAAMTLPKCVMLMMASGGASLIQLPVIGWFSQIGAVAAALSVFFGVSPEPAAACSATLLAVTFLGIIPVGLIWARFEHVSLRKVAVESEQAEEALAVEEPAYQEKP